ncbi:MAG: DUF881 domain-containing protein [Clostridia bacterium]|nr:DUF881 domain-containing protein [Clostridia bacterium]
MDGKKKGKVVMAISIGISCFALTMVMSMQFKVVDQTDITSIENMRESELRAELSNWKDKYEDVNTRYEEVDKTIKEYKNQEKSDNEKSKLLQAELSQINLELGKTDVTGEGITITLKETNNTDTAITADDLLVIVNSLKLAGAEAISINEERVINTTDIVEINNTFIKVNGQRILSPYIIKAIGEQTYLESSLLGNGGYVDELKKNGYEVTIEKNSKINIKKYEDELKSKYMQ